LHLHIKNFACRHPLSCPVLHCPALSCSVINGIQTSDIRNLFNPENIFISKEGGGAGNNWASGWTQGDQVQETLLDMIGAPGGQEGRLSAAVAATAAGGTCRAGLGLCPS
jgi:tubulin gamma